MDTYRLRIFYEKQGPAVFISGRNMLKIIERTLRRINAPLKFSEGFSPHPKISFGHPLPLHIAGTNESFDVYLTKKTDPSDLIKQTGGLLPEGVAFLSGRWMEKKAPSINGAETFGKYIIETESGINIDNIKMYGDILENTKNRVIILVKINNFSHKGLTELLLNGCAKSIVRKIVPEEAHERRAAISNKALQTAPSGPRGKE